MKVRPRRRPARWFWIDGVALVPCMGGVTLLAVRSNGNLEISGPGWIKPNAITKRILDVSPRIGPAHDCGVNHICRLGDERTARRMATALAKVLLAEEESRAGGRRRG